MKIKKFLSALFIQKFIFWIFASIFFFFFVISYSPLFSADYGCLKGIVVDSISGESINQAIIEIRGTKRGCLSNKSGDFFMSNINSGKYIISCRFGNLRTIKSIEIIAGDTLNVIFRLSENDLKTYKNGQNLVVTAGRHLQAIQEVPISISIVDSKSIGNRVDTRLDDAMRYVPGVEVNRDNISIRGSSGFSYGLGSRVAVLLDGFPILSGDQGDIKFDALPMFNTERIEVVKGAGSALYGTSALGGVINIITKDPQDSGQIRARILSGVYTKPTYPQWVYMNGLSTINGGDLSYSKMFGKFGLLLSGGIYQDNKWELYNQSFRWNLLSKLMYNFSNNDKVSFLINYALEKVDDWVYWNSLDSATRPPTGTDMTDKIYSEKLTAMAQYTHVFDDRNFLIFKGGLFGTYFENSYNPDTSIYRASLAHSYYAEAQMNSTLNDWFFLTYGGTYTQNHVIAKIYDGVNDQDIASLFAQGELKPIEKLILTIGARYDYESVVNHYTNIELSPKLGMSYALASGLNLRLSTGQGYRTPTIAERFASVPYSGFIVIPNPNLKSELSWSYEIGASYDFNVNQMPFSVDLALFRNDMINLIEPTFVSGNSLQIQFQNITHAVINGCELSVKTYVFGFLGLESSLMAMDPRDLTNNQTLKYRSKFNWTNLVFIPIGPVEFQTDYRYKSRSETIDERLGLPGGIIDADARIQMSVVDARIIYDLKKQFSTPITLTLNVKNIFNYYYTEIVGNLGMTRQITLQLSTVF